MTEFFNLRNDIVDVHKFFHPEQESKSKDGCLTAKEFELKKREVEKQIAKRKKKGK